MFHVFKAPEKVIERVERLVIPEKSPHQSSAIHLPPLKVDKTSNVLVSIVKNCFLPYFLNVICIIIYYLSTYFVYLLYTCFFTFISLNN